MPCQSISKGPANKELGDPRRHSYQLFLAKSLRHAPQNDCITVDIIITPLRAI